MESKHKFLLGLCAVHGKAEKEYDILCAQFAELIAHCTVVLFIQL